MSADRARDLELRHAYNRGRNDTLRAVVKAPRSVPVCPEVDRTKTLFAIRVPCGCPIYREDLPDVDWLCEHGNHLARMTED
jgi:hypothetical protein